MAELVPDVLEKILITLDVKDLIRCKSVCKFWHSLISSSRFVTAHMNHSYNNDRRNYEFGHRRILMSCPGYNIKRIGNSFSCSICCLLGSSNGLVCISNSKYEIFVANPSTREVKKIQKRYRPYNTLKIRSYLCWGFGYDSSADDYKVVVGSMIDKNPICFQVLSLKSNVWKDVGKLDDHEWVSYIGTLCNGALHWFMKDQNNKKVIISFNLITEEITEIPLPDDPSYEATKDYSSLGIIDECLCIYYDLHSPIWVMKSYNVQHSWTKFPSRRARKHNDVEHYLKQLKDYVPNMSIFDENIKDRLDVDSIGSHLFVQSLVSPHFTGRQKRKNDAHNSNTNDKLIKRDPSATSASARV